MFRPVWSDSNTFNYSCILYQRWPDYWPKHVGEDITVKYVIKLKYISWLLIYFVLVNAFVGKFYGAGNEERLICDCHWVSRGNGLLSVSRLHSLYKPVAISNISGTIHLFNHLKTKIDIWTRKLLFHLPVLVRRGHSLQKPVCPHITSVRYISACWP
jgi:hypothetical protein